MTKAISPGARRLGRWWPAALIAVAVVGALVGARSLARSRRSGGGAENGDVFSVDVLCTRDHQVFRVGDDENLFAGDRLGVQYAASEAGHLLVFSVDEAGEVQAPGPDGKLSWVEAPAGPRIWPGSFVMDAHHGWQRLFALWARDPVAEVTVRQAVAAALRTAGGTVQRAGRLALPVEQSSYLFRRP